MKEIVIHTPDATTFCVPRGEEKAQCEAYEGRWFERKRKGLVRSNDKGFHEVKPKELFEVDVIELGKGRYEPNMKTEELVLRLD